MTALGRSHNCCRLLCAAATADHGGHQRPRDRSRLPDEARRATALMVLDTQTGQPTGILTVADIAHAVADGKHLNEIRLRERTTIKPATTVRDAAQIMTRGHFRHLPVSGDSGLAGI